MTNMDLVNWTMREARQLSPEHHPQGEKGSASLDKLLEVLEGESARLYPPDIQLVNDHTWQVAESEPTAPLPSDLPEGSSKSATTDDLPIAAARPVTAKTPAAPLSSLLKAVVEPDIHTALADRDRAITLRWVLRDVKANRLKLSPADPRDLRDLVVLGLIEMRDNAPVLTNAGVDAIL